MKKFLCSMIAVILMVTPLTVHAEKEVSPRWDYLMSITATCLAEGTNKIDCSGVVVAPRMWKTESYTWLQQYKNGTWNDYADFYDVGTDSAGAGDIVSVERGYSYRTKVIGIAYQVGGIGESDTIYSNIVYMG